MKITFLGSGAAFTMENWQSNMILELPKETREKMWLYHYSDGKKEDCKKDGFKGWVKKGQTFEL